MKNEKIACVVIPDVHGRTFWRRAVNGREKEKIVFLGDYLDPYPWDGVEMGEATYELRHIIEFKKKYPDNVVLLLGNHDLGYLDRRVCECRMEYIYESTNREIILNNISLFDLAHRMDIGGQPVLFTHAGLRSKWVSDNADLFGSAPFEPEILNTLLHDDMSRGKLLQALSQCSIYRGGICDSSSPIWADMEELQDTDDLYPTFLHVFGHSLHRGGPIQITDCGWCLDCAKPFAMTNDFNFVAL